MSSSVCYGAETTEEWPKPLQVLLTVVSNNAGPAARTRTHYDFADLLKQSPHYNLIEEDNLSPLPTEEASGDCGKSFVCWQKVLLSSSADLLVLVQITENATDMAGRVWLIDRSMTKPKDPQQYQAPVSGGAPPDRLQSILEKPGQILLQDPTFFLKIDKKPAPVLSTDKLGPISPGKHLVEVRDETDLLQVRVVTMTPGNEVTLLPPTKPTPPAPSTRRSYRGWAALGIIAASATTAILIAGISPGHGQSNTLLP